MSIIILINFEIRLYSITAKITTLVLQLLTAIVCIASLFNVIIDGAATFCVLGQLCVHELPLPLAETFLSDF